MPHPGRRRCFSARVQGRLAQPHYPARCSGGAGGESVGAQPAVVPTTATDADGPGTAATGLDGADTSIGLSGKEVQTAQQQQRPQSAPHFGIRQVLGRTNPKFWPQTPSRPCSAVSRQSSVLSGGEPILPVEEPESKDGGPISSSTPPASVGTRSTRILDSLLGQDDTEHRLQSNAPSPADAAARQDNSKHDIKPPERGATRDLAELMTEGESLLSRLPSSQAQQVTALLSGSSSPVARALHARIVVPESSVGGSQDAQQLASDAHSAADSDQEAAASALPAGRLAGEAGDAAGQEPPSSTRAGDAGDAGDSETRKALEARRRRIIGKHSGDMSPLSPLAYADTSGLGIDAGIYPQAACVCRWFAVRSREVPAEVEDSDSAVFSWALQSPGLQPGV